MIGVKINSRLDDLLRLILSLVRDDAELAALLSSLSTLDKPDNPSLLCSSKAIRMEERERGDGSIIVSTESSSSLLRWVKSLIHVSN
jgi:hypothetical protein